MSYITVLSFDLQGAETTDYEMLRDELEKLGLRETLPKNNGLELPSTTHIGVIKGGSSGKITADISARIGKVIRERHLKGKYVISVGAKWSAMVAKFC